MHKYYCSKQCILPLQNPSIYISQVTFVNSFGEHLPIMDALVQL